MESSKLEKEVMRVKSIEDKGNGKYDVVVRQGDYLMGYQMYTFSPEVGRALPSFVTDKKPEPRRSYKQILDKILTYIGW
ncbi:hypothetical protein KY312_04615 [Candidatus Woesearchaeota archaeon]|nr:hypothetical protein [Candidatus Woesearchaeota archaeon]